MITEIFPVFGEVVGCIRNREDVWFPPIAFGGRSCKSGTQSTHAAARPGISLQAIRLKYSLLLISKRGVMEPAAIFTCWSPSLSVQKANRNQGYRSLEDSAYDFPCFSFLK